MCEAPKKFFEKLREVNDDPASARYESTTKEILTVLPKVQPNPITPKNIVGAIHGSSTCADHPKPQSPASAGVHGQNTQNGGEGDDDDHDESKFGFEYTAVPPSHPSTYDVRHLPCDRRAQDTSDEWREIQQSNRQGT